MKYLIQSLTYLEAWAVGVPGSKALRMLRCHALSASIGTSEHDGHVDGAAGHVEGLGGGVDHLVDGLHREVERHELQDGAEAVEGGAHGQAGEAHLGDGCVDDPLVSILLPQSSGHFISSVILGHLFTHDKHL